MMEMLSQFSCAEGQSPVHTAPGDTEQLVKIWIKSHDKNKKGESM